MSLRDQMSAQNPVQLLSIGATLGMVIGGKYNFALLVCSFAPPDLADYQLFGLVGHEVSSSNILLRQVSLPIISETA